MNRTSPFSSIVSVAGAVIILILAFSFDNAIDYLKVLNGRTFAITPILLWVYPLSDLVLAICLLSLFRYVNFRSTIHPSISIILVLIGLLVLLYLPIAVLLLFSLDCIFVAQWVSILQLTCPSFAARRVVPPIGNVR